MVIYGGLMWMIAGGNTDRVDKAKKALVQATIGLILVGLAYAITNFVITSLAQQT